MTSEIGYTKQEMMHVLFGVDLTKAQPPLMENRPRSQQDSKGQRVNNFEPINTGMAAKLAYNNLAAPPDESENI